MGNYLTSEIMGHSHVCRKTLADILREFSKNAFFGELNYLCGCNKISSVRFLNMFPRSLFLININVQNQRPSHSKIHTLYV